MPKNKTLALLGILLCALGLFWAVSRNPKPSPAPLQRPAYVEQQQADVAAPNVDGGAGVRHFGYVPDKQGSERFIRSLPRPFMSQAAPQLLAAQDDTPVLLYRALYEAYAATHGGAKWVVGRQEIGDCVSWGWKHGADIHLAVMWKLGDSDEWREAATEAIYGGSRVEARGITYAGMSDGSYGGSAAKFVRDWGVCFRQPYTEIGLDLSTYSGQRAKQWGAYGCGGQGDNGRLDQICKKHPLRDVVLVTTFREAAAAIQSGYPVAVCSGQGFADTRDGQGFCRGEGRWAHCMVFIGVRFDRPGLLCLNSWGPRWVSGPKWPDDQPDGSFWVDSRTCDAMLAGRDSYAVSGYGGFPLKKLKHGDWVRTEPRGRLDYLRNPSQYVLAN